MATQQASMQEMKVKRILLMEVPATRWKNNDAKKVRVGVVPPMGLAYIAAVLEKEPIKYEIKILDCLLEGYEREPTDMGDRIRYGLSDEEIKQRIKEFNPDVAGVSCLFSNKYKDSHNLCRLIKEVSNETGKDIITVIGGEHPTALPEVTMQDKNIDFIVLGEGEYTFRDLVKTLNSDQDLTKIDGLGYRQKDGTVKINPKTKYIMNLDEVPFPARHLLNMEKYLQINSAHANVRRKPYALLTSSRGCPARCTFCSIRWAWGFAYRVRSAKNVLDEIGVLVNQYGVREIHFEDDNFTFDKKRAIEILRGIKEKGYDLTLNSPSGLSVFALDDELMTVMKEGGYYEFSLAIESGDQYVLNKLMHKPVVLDRVKPIIKKARELGIRVRAFFILGYPGETKETMMKTVNFAKEAGADWSVFFVATPLPATEMYKLAEEKGYLKNFDHDWELNFVRGAIETPEFTRADVEKMKEYANLEVNFKHNANMREGKWDKAIDDFAYVSSLYPHLEFMHYYLGKAYQSKGEYEKAKAEFKKTLELNPNYEDAKIALRELEPIAVKAQT